jgi:hypothetical protein
MSCLANIGNSCYDFILIGNIYLKAGFMLQFIVSFLPLLAVIAAAFTLAFCVKCSNVGFIRVVNDFGWSIERSPAQVAFFMFSFTAAIATALVASAFAHVSNLLVISLDIIFFLSSMMLILFHQFKEYASVSL